MLNDSLFEKKEKYLMNFVSQDRRMKIERYKFEKDKKLSLYAGLLTRIGLSKISRISESDFIFYQKSMHKPYLKNENVNLKFSISHTESAIVCGISEEEIGTDIEKIKNEVPEDVLSFYSTSEIKKCTNNSAIENTYNFYWLWTRKEAYSKYRGLGLSLDISEIPTELDGFYSLSISDYMVSVYTLNKQPISILKISEYEIYKMYFSKYGFNSEKL